MAPLTSKRATSGPSVAGHMLDTTRAPGRATVCNGPVTVAPAAHTWIKGGR
jgi:hypothetical protein